MKRFSKTWLSFGGLALVAALSLGWLSRDVLRLDAEQRRSTAAAEREEKVRLALWRIDSALALLVADENARSPSEFSSFYSPVRAWLPNQSPLGPGALLVPSSLLEVPSTNHHLHFEFAPGRPAFSPQVPPAALRSLALTQVESAATLAAAEVQLEKLRELLAQPAGTGSNASRLLAIGAGAANSVPSTSVTSSTSSPGPQVATPPRSSRGNDLGQSESQARAQNFLNAQQVNRYTTKSAVNKTADSVEFTTDAGAPPVGRMVPAWLGKELFLVRHLTAPDGPRVQGVWLDWPQLRRSLLASVLDLVPEADLIPAASAAADGERHVASLPLTLVSGEISVAPMAPWSALQLALLAAWIGLGLAILAIAGLLRGALDLSERRAEFVSAVTHELRTPLTTFRIYSEMLADDMVPDAEQRRQYLATLCSESTRLGHLVENVLAYARLERGSARNRRECVSLGTLVGRVLPPLQERARQAGFEIRVDANPEVAATEVDVDVSVVEQILFNLVDNAAKYAAGAPGERTIHLEALPVRGNFAFLRVRDHGQGIDADLVGRLFEPFHRSAEKAAGSAPGVGLGLSLCRNLSRSLGGDLKHDRTVRDGAAFVLSLPRRAL